MKIFFYLLLIFLVANSAFSETVYDLWNYSEADWGTIDGEERMQKLSSSARTAMNQTLMGRFWPGYDKYRIWGYEFYELNPYYESLAFRNFEGYDVMNYKRRKWSYDDFGDRIMKMTGGFTIWSERFYTHTNKTSSKLIGARYLSTDYRTANTLGVTIATESTRDWSAKFIHAGEMQLNLTPMTLKHAITPAIRFDFWSPNNHLTAVRSLMHSPYGLPIHPRFLETGGGDPVSFTNNVVLTGLRYIRKLGALNVGTTYVNLHQYVYGLYDVAESGESRRGVLNMYYNRPAIIAVKFADDSPQDGIGGALVQNIQIIVNGEAHPEIRPEVIRRDESNKHTALGQTRRGSFNENMYYEFESRSRDRPNADYWRGMEIPYYADYIMKSLLAGELEVQANPQYYNYSPSYIKNLGDSGGAMVAHLESGASLSAGQKRGLLTRISRTRLDRWVEMLDPNSPQEANGYNILVYYFDLKDFERVNSVAIECIVGNDYEISTAMISVDNQGNAIHASPDDHLRSTFWKVIKEASGNIRDRSNLKRISFDVGTPTAIEYMGFDIDTVIKGFEIKGEYVHSFEWMQYPDGKPWTERPHWIIGLPPRKGWRFGIKDKAYWLTLKKESRFWGIGGELYHHGPQYETRLLVEGLSAVDTQWEFHKNGTYFYPTVEDNDDNDKWPDQWNGEIESGHMEIITQEDIDGVFPGLDEDNDGIPDTNRNGNPIPDYEEPFLRYYVDQPEFIYGDDFNNNGYPDYMEDDLEPDTPYDRGQAGRHFYLKLKPFESMYFTLGRHDGGLAMGGGRNRNHYMKFNVLNKSCIMGSFFFEITRERIQDNIPDYVYTFAPTKPEILRVKENTYGIPRQFFAEWVDDEMMYRDSKVYRVYFQTQSRRYFGLTFINQIRFERNNQMGGYIHDQSYQKRDQVNLLTMINRLDGLYRWGKLSFMPGLKLKFLKRERKSMGIPLSHQRTIIPRTIFQYDFSERTNVKVGAEMLPWLCFRHYDLGLPYNDRRENNYLIEASNRSIYFGYTVYAFAGLQFETVKFDNPLRKFENRESSSAYMRVIIGY